MKNYSGKTKSSVAFTFVAVVFGGKTKSSVASCMSRDFDGIPV